jgi:hypothetical protein
MSEEEPIQQPKPSPSWRFWMFLAAIFIITALLIAPFFIRKRGCRDAPAQANNLRQIGLALYEFEKDYGSYPNDATAALVTKHNPAHGHKLSGTSSNALFRQLFAANLTQSEEMFYAKIPSVRRPDGDISPGRLLEKGEVGFAYVAGLTSVGNPARPIAFAPVIPGTTRFDPEPFDGYAVFLRIDNSVSSMTIGKDGYVRLGGIDILSPENPIWDGQAPDIRYPEL